MAHLQLFTKPHVYFFLFYFLFISFSISATISQETQPTTPVSTDPSYYYNLCAPSWCNNLSLPYPFSLPTSCHPSRVEPLCPTNQSFLLTSSLTTDTFRVLSLNYNDPTLARVVVASDSLFTCGSQISRPNYASDASIFSLPSNYTPGTHLNCTSPIPSGSIRGLQNASCLGCNDQDPNNVCYFAPGFVSYRTCETFHTVTHGGPLNATSVRDLRAFLQSGYEMRYVKSP